MANKSSLSILSSLVLPIFLFVAPGPVRAQKVQNVNIQSSSTTVPVTVTNPVTLSPETDVKLDTSVPIRVRDTENPARHAVQLQCFANLPPDNPTNFCMFKSANNEDYRVPAGKRLVIEAVSGTFQTYASLVSGPCVQLFDVPTFLNGLLTSVSHYFVPVQVPSKEGYVTVMFSQQVRLYADGASQVMLIVERTSNVTGNLQGNLSGYLVNCTGPACTGQ